jgi:hypothetical protein
MSSLNVGSRHDGGEGSLSRPPQWRLSHTVPRGRYIDPWFVPLEAIDEFLFD